MAKIIVRISVIVGTIGIVLGGCGSDDKASTTGSSTSSAPTAGAPVSLPGTVNEPKVGDATSGSIEVALNDFSFGPSFVKAKPGATVTLKITNKGTKPHTFTSTALNIDETLQPGEPTIEKSVTLPSSGATQFHCTFHQSQGMQGAFFFNDGDAVGAAATDEPTTTSDPSYYN